MFLLAEELIVERSVLLTGHKLPPFLDFACLGHCETPVYIA
jgi:hypothetical protein